MTKILEVEDGDDGAERRKNWQIGAKCYYYHRNLLHKFGLWLHISLWENQPYIVQMCARQSLLHNSVAHSLIQSSLKMGDDDEMKR